MAVVQGGGVTFDEGESVRNAGAGILNASAQIVQAIQAKKQLALIDAEQRRTSFFDNAAKFSQDPNDYLNSPAGKAEYEGYLRAQNDVANADRLFGSLFQKNKGMTPEQTTASMLDMNNMSAQGLASISAGSQFRDNLLAAGSQARAVAGGAGAQTAATAQAPVVAPRMMQTVAPTGPVLTTQNTPAMTQAQALTARQQASGAGASPGLMNTTTPEAGAQYIDPMYQTGPVAKPTTAVPTPTTGVSPQAQALLQKKLVTKQTEAVTSSTLRTFFNDYATTNPDKGLIPVATDFSGGVDDAAVWNSLPKEKQTEFITKTGVLPSFEALPTSKFAQKAVETKVAKLNESAGKANEILTATQNGAPLSQEQKMSFKAALAQTGNNYGEALKLVPADVRKAINESAVNQVLNSSSLKLQVMGATTLADRQAKLEELDASAKMVEMQMTASAMGEAGLQLKDLLESTNKEDEILSKQEADYMSSGKYKTTADMWKDNPGMKDRRNNLTTLKELISKNIDPDMTTQQRFERYQVILGGWFRKNKLGPEDDLGVMSARREAARSSAVDNAYSAFGGQ